MGKVDRFGVILSQLSSGNPIAVDDLAAELNVSGATVRRDLGELARQGLLTRTHGGAVARDVGYELPVMYRSGRQMEQKRRIAAAASKLVPEGAVVGISGGSTTTEVARAIAGQAGLTVVTNALNIATELALRPNIQLMVTGGMARSASFELVGSIAEQTIESYNLDIVLLGVDGIEAEVGCTTHDVIEARTNAAMVRRSRRVVVLADATKIGHVAFAGICRSEDVDVLITDQVVAADETSNGADSASVDRPVDVEGALDRLAERGLDVRQV